MIEFLNMSFTRIALNISDMKRSDNQNTNIHGINHVKLPERLLNISVNHAKSATTPIKSFTNLTLASTKRPYSNEICQRTLFLLIPSLVLLTNLFMTSFICVTCRYRSQIEFEELTTRSRSPINKKWMTMNQRKMTTQSLTSRQFVTTELSYSTICCENG